MKRWLAILSAMLLLLCSVPLTVATVSAATEDGNLFYFGDFDSNYGSGWDFYQGTIYCQGGALHGNNGAKLQGYGGWGSMMEQTVQTKLGQAYHLEFWFKVVQNGFNWRLEQGGGEGLYETRWETATEWTHVSYDFVASSEWVTLNFCGSGNGIPETAYVDDVVLTPIASTDYDGYISNGNFESGEYIGWFYHEPSSWSPDAALAGAYGAHLQGDGDWDSMAEQAFYTEPGAEYAVMFFYQVNQNGFHAQVLGSSSCNNILSEVWCEETEPTMEMLTFVADGEYAIINFSGAGNGIPEDAYVDEVYVFSNETEGEHDLTDDDQTKWKTLGYVTYWETVAAFEDGVGIHAKGYGEGKPILERTFATVAEAGYNLSFLYQNNKEDVGFTCVIEDGITHEVLYSNAYGGTSWGQEEILFTATSGTTVLRFVGDGGVEKVDFTREDFYLDQMYLVSYEEEQPAPPHEIKNGDFEAHQLVGWSVYQGTALTPFAASEGNQGVLLQGNGGWGGLLEQGFFTEPGGEYELTFSYKVLSNGFNLQVRDGSGGNPLAANWYTDGEWTEASLTFTAQSGTARLNFCGGGNGIPESAYLDNVVLTRLDAPDIPDIPDLPDLPDISYEEIAVGETKEVTLSEELGMSLLLFTPAESGWYAFTSYGDCDTYILVSGEDGEGAVFNDNDADGSNFRAVSYCAADTPYVLMLTTKAFSGTFDVAVEAVETTALFPDTTPIRYGDTVPVELAQMGVSQVFSFVPTEDGTYILTAEGAEDTYCFLYDVDGEMVTMFDDESVEEENYNFVAAYDCTAGNTYYFLVSSYAEGDSAFTMALTAEEEPPTPPVIYGDANGDDAVNNLDVALLQQYINGWDVTLDEVSADANGDGAVNNLDVALLQQHINGWDVTLG